DELRQIFRGGVVMDADAWQAMEQLGLAGWTGVRAAKPFDIDSAEQLSRHPLNGKFAGYSRDCRQSFWKERAWALAAASEKTAALSHIHDYGGKPFGTAMTAFENELGGRVVIMGYYPWSQVHSLAKSSQIKAVVDWVSAGRLPALVESYSKINLWCRNRAAVLLNTSLDPAEGVVLRWQGSATAFRLHSMNGATRGLTAVNARLSLPALEPWSMHLVTEA
ncbi:MAG: hypothetical protein NTY38_12635, partial [Acidobacteria bacterium]|nr:hypothetical protein [Acidobacteriota bacterium]